jgi:hypothetical protein
MCSLFFFLIEVFSNLTDKAVFERTETIAADAQK